MNGWPAGREGERKGGEEEEFNPYPLFQVGELLKDWRRTNVAFTRSKRKLIIIGSMRTLSGAMLFSDLFNFLLSRNWVCEKNGVG